MQHFGKGALRVAKNYTKGYSDTQAKVRDATSNDSWGPSGTQMNEIAQLTYNQADFVEVMEMLDKRLNDKGKNWRHVFKSLTVLDYCLHAGSENVVIYFRDNVYIIKTLKEFQYIDEEGKDQGANVRQKAKDITNLLQDEARLREERKSRASMRDRMVRGGAEEQDHGEFEETNENNSRRRGGRGGEDELKRAIEESKRTAALEGNKSDGLTDEERDLIKAMELSEEEEKKRNKAVADSNERGLFDDTAPVATPTSSNNPFPFTDPTPYAVGLQPQFTAFQPQQQQLQPQYTAMPMQQQFTAFNPYQQQAEQEAMQAEYLRQQQAFQQQQQQEEWMRQQQLQQQQMLQQQQQQQPFQPPMQSLAPQPTGFGSKNPFAPATSTSAFQSQSPPPPTSQPAFNLQGTYANSPAPSSLSSASSNPYSNNSSNTSASASSPASSVPRVQTRNDNQHAQLESLFADREGGQDTFGNIGALRFGQQAGNVIATQKTGATGHNPFALQQQQQQQQNSERPFFDI